MLLRNLNSVNINARLEPPLLLGDENIIAAHHPLTHTTILRKGPVLEPITPLPLQTVVCVAKLIPELHCNLVVMESKELFAEHIVNFAGPFILKEGDYFRGAVDKVVAITPNAIVCVGFGYFLWVSGL
jgi:hypothetical protein